MLLEMATEGDTIITLEVSRLSRSTQQLCEIIDIIKSKKLRLIIVGSITVDCRSGQIDPMSQAFIQMSAVFAELELSIIRARVRSGMENAKSKGKRIGRPHTTKENIPPIFYKHYPALVLSTFMRKKVSRQRKKRVVMQWRNRREQPPGASCSCISCCPTECLRHGAGERRRALGRNCRQGRHPRPGCACGSRG